MTFRGCVAYISLLTHYIKYMQTNVSCPFVVEVYEITQVFDFPPSAVKEPRTIKDET